MKDRIYVPILKGKEGEYGALRELGGETKSSLVPVIEVPPIPTDFVTETEARTLEEHIAPLGKKLEDSWGTDHPIFIDFGWLEEDRLLVDGMHPVTSVMGDMGARGIRAIPVTGLGKVPVFQTAIRDAVQADQRGVCIRLEGDDFQNLPAMAGGLAALVDELGVAPADADLIIDLAEITPAQVGPMRLAARSILAVLPIVPSWRTIALAGCGFPQNLGQLAPNSATLVPRTEWMIWENIVQDPQGLPRLPTFADCAVNNPVLSEVDPRQMRMSASLRYTVERNWLVFKGRNVRTFGHAQFNAICTQLVGRPEYSGPGFSWGDWYARRCADGADGPGNATTWRKVATSHHLAFATQQVATMLAP